MFTYVSQIQQLQLIARSEWLKLRAFSSFDSQTSIKSERRIMRDKNHQKNIWILQHNCAKSTNIMTSCLEFAVKKADIILIQESWIEQNQIIISHPSFICIMSNLDESDKHKSRVLTFVSKTFHLNVTSRPDIFSNTDI